MLCERATVQLAVAVCQLSINLRNGFSYESWAAVVFFFPLFWNAGLSRGCRIIRPTEQWQGARWKAASWRHCGGVLGHAEVGCYLCLFSCCLPVCLSGDHMVLPWDHRGICHPTVLAPHVAPSRAAKCILAVALSLFPFVSPFPVSPPPPPSFLQLIILEDYADPFDAEQAGGGTQTSTEKVTTENDGYMEPYEAQKMMAGKSLPQAFFNPFLFHLLTTVLNEYATWLGCMFLNWELIKDALVC